MPDTTAKGSLIKKGMRIPWFTAGVERTPLSAEAIAPLVATLNAYLNLEVKRAPATANADGTFTNTATVDISDEKAVITLFDAPGGDSAFWNTVQTGTATCPTGTTGGPLTVTVSANTVGSHVSVADANLKAQEIAQYLANTGIVCTVNANDINGQIDGIRLRPDGTYFIFGGFTKINGYSRPFCAVINPDFSPSLECWKPAPNWSSGSPTIVDAAVDASGNIYIVSPNIVAVDCLTAAQMFALAADGGIPGDYTGATFTPPTIPGSFPAIFGPIPGAAVTVAHVDSRNGNILIGGGFSIYGTQSTNIFNVIRISPAGVYNNTFVFAVSGNTGGTVVMGPINCLETTAAGGGGSSYIFWSATYIGSCSSIGASPTGFQPFLHGLSGVGIPKYGCAMQGTNLIVVGSNVLSSPPAGSSFGIHRVDASASTGAPIDTTFYTYTHRPWPTGAPQIYCVAVDPSTSKIYMGGASGMSGYGVLVGGSWPDKIIRLNSDGSPDSSWQADVDGLVNQIIIEPSGNVVLVGNFTHAGTTANPTLAVRKRICRFDNTGALL